MFQLNPGLYTSVFAVPAEIVDKYIKLASASAIKALLWILRHQGDAIDATEITKRIGGSESETQDALEYWVSVGVLLENGKNLSVKAESFTEEEPATVANVKDVVPKAQKVLPEIKISKPTLQQLRARMAESEEVLYLLQESQKILGRTFGFDMQSTLLMLLDTYGLKLEVILTLLQFCVQQGKDSTAYIAKLGKIWAEKEINTLEQADVYIQNSLTVNKLFIELKELTGISSPRPTAKQSEYLTAWMALGFDVEMIALSFEETSDRTGKISFNYMNRILLNWHKEGYKTPMDVKNGEKAYKEKKASKSETQRSYDLDAAVNGSTYQPPKYTRKSKAEK